jgi:hypothetical protein
VQPGSAAATGGLPLLLLLLLAGECAWPDGQQLLLLWLMWQLKAGQGQHKGKGDTRMGSTCLLGVLC